MLQTPPEQDQAVPGTDVPGQIDVNPATLIERIDSWVDSGVKLIPNMVVALVVLLIVWGLSRIIARWVRGRAHTSGRDNLGDVLAGFVRAAGLIGGAMLAATIVFPSITPARVLGSLGIGSVAIGFAFKDILQNWLAGMLILVRRPFDAGDQIAVRDFEGTVKVIETRATRILTYDGQEVLIPNAELYTNSVTVRTAHEVRRTQYDVALAIDQDIGTVLSAFREILASIPTIETDPAPDCFVWDLSAKSFTVRSRWWTDSRRSDVVGNQAAFLRALKEGLESRGIALTFDESVEVRLLGEDERRPPTSKIPESVQRALGVRPVEEG